MRNRLMALVAGLLAVFGLAGAAVAGPATASPAQASSAVVTTVTPNYVEVVAPLVTADGLHYFTFYSCTVDGRRARAKIGYVTDHYTIRLSSVLYETDWNDHPAFTANAVRWDVEYNPGVWAEESPEWGGSSTTLDDMPSYYNRLYSDAGGALVFDDDAPAHQRVRFYGVGAGSATGRCDDYAYVDPSRN
jgi:hypothetical protein